MMSKHSDVADALRAVRKALESTARDFSSMPFFVRPMVKKGFARRTGRSLDAWLEHIGRAIADVGGNDRAESLATDLEKLADNFRTAPERARRAMKGAALEAITERSRERERATLAAIEALRSEATAAD